MRIIKLTLLILIALAVYSAHNSTAAYITSTANISTNSYSSYIAMPSVSSFNTATFTIHNYENTSSDKVPIEEQIPEVIIVEQPIIEEQPEHRIPEEKDSKNDQNTISDDEVIDAQGDIDASESIQI